MNDGYMSITLNAMDLQNFGGPNVQKQAESVLKSDHLLQVGISSVGAVNITIDAICVQSSHPSQKPHHLKIITHPIWSEWRFDCSCKAGLGQRCKHILAVLLYIEKYKRIQILTCTQLQQKWDNVPKQVIEGILQPDKIADLQEVKGKRKIVDPYISPEERLLIVDVLFSDPKSGVFQFINAKRKRNVVDNQANTLKASAVSIFSDTEPQNPMESYLSDLFETTNLKMRIHFFNRDETPAYLIRFYNHSICIDKDTAFAIQRKTITQSLSLDWRRERRKRITSSECYGLFTYFVKQQHSKDEWAVKVRNYFKYKPDCKNLRIGREQEPYAFRLYEESVGATVFKVGLLVHPSCPWLAASPDGFCLETDTLLEIKCVMNEKDEPFISLLKKLPYLKHCIDSSNEVTFELRPKHKYYAQIQLNMCLLNCKNCDLVIYEYKQKIIKIIHVAYDEVFISNLITTLFKVYISYCLEFIYKNTTTDTDKINFF